MRLFGRDASDSLCSLCEHRAGNHFRHPARSSSLCCRDCEKFTCAESTLPFDFNAGGLVVMTDDGIVEKTRSGRWKFARA